MAILNNLIIAIFFCLIFANFPAKLIFAENATDSKEYIADTYYKKYLTDYYYKQGKEFYGQGRYREAIFKFKSALECDPDYRPAAIFVTLIEAKVQQQQKVEEQKITRKKERKDELAKKYFSRYYYKQGMFYFSKASYQEAMDKFKEALKWIPDYEPALKYLVLSEERLTRQIKLEEQKIAEKERKEENEAKEKLADFYYKQGREYFNQKKYNEAISGFKQALEAYPQHKGALRYITLSEDRISRQQDLKEQRRLAEKKNKEERERKEKLIAAKKEIEEKISQRQKQEEERRLAEKKNKNKQEQAKKETVHKIAQEVKEKAAGKPAAQKPVVEQISPTTVPAEEKISPQQKQEEGKKPAEKPNIQEGANAKAVPAAAVTENKAKEPAPESEKNNEVKK